MRPAKKVPRRIVGDLVVRIDGGKIVNPSDKSSLWKGVRKIPDRCREREIEGHRADIVRENDVVAAQCRAKYFAQSFAS